MGHVVRIGDPGDERLHDFVALTDVQLRRRTEPERGLFIAEGEKVIRRALAAGYRLRSLLLADKWLPALTDVVESTDAPVLVADDALIETTTGFAVHRGALAAMHREPLPDLAALLSGARRVVVLEDVNDHTNVGAVFRNAAALGIDAVVLSPRCADPLYRRAIKVSMGAVFSVPYTRLDSWYGGIAAIRAYGFAVLALTPAADATPIDALDEDTLRRCALVLGAEGSGVTPHWLREADLRVRIPMSREVDSLNVAAAAAIACWVVTRAGVGAV